MGNMAGMEGYFGPNERSFAQGINPSARERWNSPNEEYYTRRSNVRPSNIDVQPHPAQKNLSKPSPSDDEEEAVRRYINYGIGIATLIAENLLSHPFVVLRRQCQVHNNSQRFHLVPFTLIPVIYRLNQRQGITTLWKGLGSVLLVRGMALAVEDIISKFTPWPKEITRHSSLKACCQHVFLKCLTLAIVTPFYSASLVETVQSDIASEKPGIFDVFKEGICRLVSWGSPQKGRMLPVWKLVIPTVMYGFLKHVFAQIIQSLVSGMMHLNQRQARQKQGAYPKDCLNQSVSQDIELTSSLVALVAAESVFYPLETILHRLHLQGTRTIIDNLDSGREVIPILTSYEGPIDCYDTTLRQEGVSGLYKGFGALVLQFTAHTALIKLTKFVLTQATQLLRSSSPPPLSPVVTTTSTALVSTKDSKEHLGHHVL